jgi:hypothetical protein
MCSLLTHDKDSVNSQVLHASYYLNRQWHLNAYLKMAVTQQKLIAYAPNIKS